MGSAESVRLPLVDPSDLFCAQKLLNRAIRHHKAGETEGETDAAMRLYDRLIREGAASPDVYNNFGILSGEQRLTEAIANVRTAVELRPESADFHMNLANMLGESGAFAEASREYDRAIQLDPGRPEIHQNMGQFLYRQRNYGRAIECFERAVRRLRRR